MPRDLYNLNSRYGTEEQLIRQAPRRCCCCSAGWCAGGLGAVPSSSLVLHSWDRQRRPLLGWLGPSAAIPSRSVPAPPQLPTDGVRALQVPALHTARAGPVTTLNNTHRRSPAPPRPGGCRCVKSLQERGIKVLGDAVLNHRCAQYHGSGGVWNQFGGKMAWDERAIVGACAAVCPACGAAAATDCSRASIAARSLPLLLRLCAARSVSS